MLSAPPASVHALISVTTSASRDMIGSNALSDSVLRARAGASAPSNPFALDSLSLSTWERWSVNRSLGELIWSANSCWVAIIVLNFTGISEYLIYMTFMTSGAIINGNFKRFSSGFGVYL